MYHKVKSKATKTSITRNTSYEGESIEQKINRIVNNKEPITDGAPLIYTERKDGVHPAMDIRTDRWEIAAEAKDKIVKVELARRQERIDAQMKKDKPEEKTETKADGGAESTQATDAKK